MKHGSFERKELPITSRIFLRPPTGDEKACRRFCFVWKGVAMNISVILAHPYAQSFNAAIAAVVVKTLNEFDHAVRFHDLYREHFDPVIPEDELVGDQSRDPLVRLHQEEIRTADGIVIIHPRQRRWTPHWSAACEKSACLQHLQHSCRAGKRRIRRSSAASLARLHLWLLRRNRRRSVHVPHCR